MATSRRIWQRRYSKRRARVPIIDPRAVKAYRARKLDDWRWIKEVPREALEELVAEKKYRFHTKPRLHQLACFVLGAKMPRFGFLLDMGSGKTRIVLDQVRYRKQRGELKTALVCVPNLINLPSWEDQIAQHAPDLTYRVLDGTKASRMSKLRELRTKPVDLCIINYAGLPVYMAKAGSERKKRKSWNTSRIDQVKAAQFASRFNFIALDEPHLVLSSHTSLTFELTSSLSAVARYCYITTGTLFGRDPMKAWPQLRVMDLGETLGQSLGMYQTAFFIPEEDHFAGVKWKFDRSKDGLLNRVLQHRSIRYEDKEFTDLPKLMPANRILVKMSQAQMTRYRDILKEQREDPEAHKATWIRLRQTVSGFIAVPSEEDTARLEVAFDPNPKADALEQYLLELPEDEKVLIWHEYIASGKIIQGVLKRMKRKFAGVGSGFKDVKVQRETFMTSPSCLAFVANHKAGGTGADGLQKVCRHMIFYETPTSPDRRRQCIKRLFRDGQQRRVYVSDLVASNVALEQDIHASLEEGMDLFEAVLNRKRKIK